MALNIRSLFRRASGIFDFGQLQRVVDQLIAKTGTQQTITGGLTITGGPLKTEALSLGSVTTVTDDDYTVTDADSVLIISAANTATDVTLPDIVSTSQTLLVKVLDVTAGATLTPDASDKVNGANAGVAYTLAAKTYIFVPNPATNDWVRVLMIASA